MLARSVCGKQWLECGCGVIVPGFGAGYHPLFATLSLSLIPSSSSSFLTSCCCCYCVALLPTAWCYLVLAAAVIACCLLGLTAFSLVEPAGHYDHKRRQPEWRDAAAWGAAPWRCRRC